MFMFLGILSFLLFLVMLVVSINPKWISRGEKKYTRKQILLSAGVMFVLFCIFAINDGSNNSAAALPPTTSAVTAPVKTPEQIAIEKVAADKITSDKAAAVKAEADKMSSDILYYSQVKAKEVFKDRLVKVEKDAQGILITFKLAENLSMKWTGDGGFTDASKMFSLYKGHTGDYIDVTCLGTFPMKDKFGTVTNDTIFAITLDKDTIQKITFENLDPTKDLIPLSSSHAIRPELIK